ncbi:hypothetical protein F5B21DRAFT_463446 [Xylaria acuta]|nr:hypothetical protein F5B21DRAFT_463446 [Xylaria acuta]
MAPRKLPNLLSMLQLLVMLNKGAEELQYAPTILSLQVRLKSKCFTVTTEMECGSCLRRRLGSRCPCLRFLLRCLLHKGSTELTYTYLEHSAVAEGYDAWFQGQNQLTRRLGMRHSLPWLTRPVSQLLQCQVASIPVHTITHRSSH